MAQHIEDFCEERARAGDGSFAIAHATYTLAREQKILTSKVGDLDEIAGALLRIADAVQGLEKSDG